MTALIALVRADLILFLADRRALILTLLMPVVLGAFFGYLFGGSGSSDNAKIEIAVVSLDDSRISQQIVLGLKADTSLQTREIPLPEARALVLKGKLNAAIVIPAGFGTAAGGAFFGGSKKPEIEVFYDPSQSAVLGMVKGLLTQQVMQTVSAEMFSGNSGEKFVDQSITQLETATQTDPTRVDLLDFLHGFKKFQRSNQDRIANGAQTPASGTGGLTMPFVTRDQAMTAGPKYNAYAHSFAGMSIQ